MTFSSALQPVGSGMNANVHRSLQFLVAPPSLFLGRFKGGGGEVVLETRGEMDKYHIVFCSSCGILHGIRSSQLTESVHPLE